MRYIDIVLTDNFPILSLSLITEPLRVVNRERMQQVYAWRFLSVEGGRVSSSSGIEIETLSLDYEQADVILLLSAYQPEKSIIPRLLSWLRKRSKEDVLLGCVDTAALIFAEAGLLSHIPAATHFEAIRGYSELYPGKFFIDRLFHVAGNRCSSAGGVATIDMTLKLIEKFDGGDIVRSVAEILTYKPSDHDNIQQKLLVNTSIQRMDRNLAKAVDLMLVALDQPLSICVIAERVGMPAWKLNRLFKKHLKKTSSNYYRYLRLQQAKNLVKYSHLSIAQLAALCGFENPETFSRAYKREFGLTAANERAL